MAKEVMLLDFWPSPFGMRVRIALAEKGGDYEYIEENLRNKSELLLKMNPVHKKIPVFVHNNKPVSESLIIVQYIDEVWNSKNPLMPSDPYQRAQTRFWADFIEKKMKWYREGYTERVQEIRIAKSEEQETAKKDLIEHLKVLEQQLGDKPYFGGDTFGFVDVTLVPYYSWFYTYEMAGNFKIDEACPKIVEWVKRCLERESVAKALPDQKKVYEFVLEMKKKLGIE